MLAPLGKSDHMCILIDLNLSSNKFTSKFVKSKKKLWREVNPPTLVEFAKDTSWDYSSNDICSETMWEELKTKLLTISDKVPSCDVNSSKGRRPVWDNTKLKRKRQDKDKFWLMFDNDPSAHNLSLALGKQEIYAVSYTHLTLPTKA